MSALLPCPCGTGRPYAECCARHHAGQPAPDAERLMRSRYSAYVRKDTAYLLATWHPATRPATLDLDQAPEPKWLGLKVLRHEQTGPDHALVEFVARYKVAGRAQRMHEASRFERIDGHWLYVDGELNAP